jgi:hypothetical protein
MTEPDKSGSSMNSMLLAGPVAIFFLMMTVWFFKYRDSLPNFFTVLWIALPLFAFVFVSCANLISQRVSCNRVDAGKAFLGGLPVIGTVLVGLGIASVTNCRIPVASVFAPLFVGETLDIVKDSMANSLPNGKNRTTKRCCVPRISLEYVERNFPMVAGLNYGFYVLFSVLFGFVFGNSLATIC